MWGVPFLRDLPDEAIAAAGRERRLQKGELLFAENSPTLGLIVVLDGTIHIYKSDARGREMTLGRESAGGSVAELPLFDGGDYPASAEAAEDAQVLIVPRERFLQVMAAHPRIAEAALRALASRMRLLVQRVEAQTLHPVRARLAAYLLRAAAGKATFPLTDTNGAIGSQVGTVRDVVSRTLRRLEDGLIALQGRRIERPRGRNAAASSPPNGHRCRDHRNRLRPAAPNAAPRPAARPARAAASRPPSSQPRRGRGRPPRSARAGC